MRGDPSNTPVGKKRFLGKVRDELKLEFCFEIFEDS